MRNPRSPHLHEIIISPSINNEWNNFIKSQPDITSVIEWLNNHSDYFNFENLFHIEFSSNEPENVFSQSVLEEWARENDWVQEIDEFSEDDIIRYCNQNFDPKEIYKEKDMIELAKTYGYVNKKELLKYLNE